MRGSDAQYRLEIDFLEAVNGALDQALKSAHHIQDYHFCARVTAP